MKKFFSTVWFYWKKIGLFIGNIISAVLLTVFYFVVFSFFALPVRWFLRVFDVAKPGESNFRVREKNASSLEDFLYE